MLLMQMGDDGIPVGVHFPECGAVSGLNFDEQK